MSDPIDRELRQRLLERQKDERIAQQHAAALAKLPQTREQELERENAALRAEVAHLKLQLRREETHVLQAKHGAPPWPWEKLEETPSEDTEPLY